MRLHDIHAPAGFGGRLREPGLGPPARTQATLSVGRDFRRFRSADRPPATPTGR